MVDAENPTRCNAVNTCNGHTGPVVDFDFNPFDDNQLASCSEDCSSKKEDDGSRKDQPLLRIKTHDGICVSANRNILTK